MILLQTDTSISLFERLSNPILALLLFALFAAVGFLSKAYVNKETAKAKEIKELYDIILQMKTSDTTIIAELKNTLAQHTQVETDNTHNIQRMNELLLTLLTKIEFMIKP